MKFSSISIIAAALATIVGGAITAPDPLHTRTLAVDNLFKRELGHQEDHRYAAVAMYKAEIASRLAAESSYRRAARQQTHLASSEAWQERGGLHEILAEHFADRKMKHLQASQSPVKSELHDQILTDRAFAKWCHHISKNTMEFVNSELHTARAIGGHLA